MPVYGWYSELQRQVLRDIVHQPVAVYLTPAGREVVVTEITHGDSKPGGWADMTPVGEVVRWLRSEVA